MTSHQDRQPDGGGAVPATKKDFEERVKALIKAAKEEQVKRIGPLEVETARHKEALAGVNTEVNLLKGEMTFMAGSFKGLESNVRVWGKDFNIIGDFLARRRGEDPAQLRGDIRSLQTRVQRAQTTADHALQRQRDAAQRGAQGSRSGHRTADVQNLTQASQAIDRLERRINRLVSELG
ncbi:hypothetical protein AB0H82_30520 [Streptomyces sp. NPDC050732]|uniref:hypothetical protein n=1 Tax=Streptomyces sp. NPDC050732 TaxID=3154632 RepID=UPI00342886EC